MHLGLARCAAFGNRLPTGRSEALNEIPQEAPLSSVEHLISLLNGLDLLAKFSSDTPSFTINTAAETLDISRASARRILLTLSEAEYLRQEGRNFRPTAKVLSIGFNYFSSLGLPRLARPALDRLCVETGESVSLNVLEHNFSVLVARAEPQRLMQFEIGVGRLTPAYLSSAGRMLMAGESDVAIEDYVRSVNLVPWASNTIRRRKDLSQAIMRARRDNYAVASNEIREGLSSISVPVRSADGKTIAAVNIYVIDTDSEEDLLSRFRAKMDAAARDIEEVAGQVRPV